MEVRKFNHNKCECWSCKRTFPYFGTESPMLNDTIWSRIAGDEPTIEYTDEYGETWEQGGFLCKDCMESRLGRPLKYDDLMKVNGDDVPFNSLFIQKHFKEICYI